MNKLISITAILLGTSNIAQAETSEASQTQKTFPHPPFQTQHTAQPRAASGDKNEPTLLISSLHEHLQNDSGQKKLNASCN